MKVPDEVFAQICTGMKDAEGSEELDELFRDEIHTPVQISKDDFLHLFNTGMKLYKSTFKKVLGYEMTWPGFVEEVLLRLEDLGCSRAREYYEAVKGEWQREHGVQMKSVAHWYREQGEKEFEDKKRKVVRGSRKDLSQMNNSELLMYLESLTAGV